MGLIVGLSQPIVIANGGTGATTKAPAFDALQPMTTGGDIIYGGASGTGTRLANGVANQVLISNGGTAAPSWAANAPTYNYTAQTSVYTAVINDCVLCTTGTFTVTLPTAVGQAGKRIMVTNSGTGVITLATTSAQTVMGLASTKILLATTNDSIEMFSDGANWQVLSWNINVSLYYTGTPTGTITGTYSVATYPTKTIDTYSGYSSGAYTVVVPGTYYISAGHGQSASYSVSNFGALTIGFNGSTTQIASGLVVAQANPGALTYYLQASASYKLAVGDIIRVYAASSGATPTFSGGWLTMARTGN